MATMTKLPPHVIAVSKAKDMAQQWMKYLGGYLEGCPTIFDSRVPTMGVDSDGRLYINPQWVEQWSVEQNAYVLLHEMCHNLLNHAERRLQAIPNANPQQLECWNVAADLCIQQVLEEWDCHRPQPSVEIRDYVGIPGMVPGLSTERYYGILWNNGNPQQPKGKQPGGQSGSASDGVKQDYELESDLTSAATNMARLEDVRQQMEDDGSIGKGSGMGQLRQSLNVRLRRQPDPFDQLKSIVGKEVSTTVGVDEYTYRRLSRMQQHPDHPMRGVIKVSPECVIVLDTSDSMGAGPRGERVSRALTAIAQGCRRLQNPRVISWDDGLRNDKRCASIRDFNWIGGGGTGMSRAVEFADKKYKPDCIVLVTDCGTCWPDKPTRAPPKEGETKCICGRRKCSSSDSPLKLAERESS